MKDVNIIQLKGVVIFQMTAEVYIQVTIMKE